MKTDSELKSNLMAQLNMKLGRSAGNIRVSVLNGIVTLGGFTPTDRERKAAQEIVMHLQGVLAFVDCLISYRPPERSLIPSNQGAADCNLN